MGSAHLKTSHPVKQCCHALHTSGVYISVQQLRACKRFFKQLANLIDAITIPKSIEPQTNLSELNIFKDKSK